MKIRFTDLKEELFNLRFQNATNQLDNPMRMVSVKKEIASVQDSIKRKRTRFEFKHKCVGGADKWKSVITVRLVVGEVVSDKMDKTIVVAIKENVEAPALRQGNEENL